MSSGDMERPSNDDKPSLEQQSPKPLDVNQQRSAVPPRPRRVGYAMSQAPRHRRTSGNADFVPSTAYHQQQQIAAAMAAAAQQCYPATMPFFIQQNGPAGATPNGFDTQFVTYPTTGHLEAPFLFYDGKSYSIIPASMIPSTSASFNHLGYFLTPAAAANPAAPYRPFLPADAAIAAEQPQRIPCVETSDKAVQVNLQTQQTESAPVAPVVSVDNNNEEEDYWSVGSHNDDLCKRVELCNLIENSNYQHKDEEASEKCSTESYDGSMVGDKKLDTWDATVFSVERNKEPSPICDQIMFNNVVPRQQQEEEEERPVQQQTDAQPASNHRKSWASLFKPGGQHVAANGSQSDSTTSSGALQSVQQSMPVENISPQWCTPKTAPSTGGRYNPRYRIVPNDFIQIGGFFRNFECRQSAPALTPRGFYNSGNYCYVNSVLQALLACPMFFNFIGSLPHLRDAGKLPTSSEEGKENNTEESSGRSENAKMLFAPTFISRVKQIFDSFPPMQRTSQSARGAPPHRRNLLDLKIGEPMHIEDFHNLAQSLWSNKALGQQEDAHEFLCHILQEIHNECLLCMKLASNSGPSKETKETVEANGENEDDGDSEWQEYYGKRVHIHREIPLDATPISEIFAGCFRTSLERGGSITSSNMEPFYSLSLDGDCPTIMQALKALNTRVPVAGLANPITKKPTKAFQSMMIEKLPPCLIFHVRCFVWNKPNGVIKLFPKMMFPVDLTIPQEIMSRTSSSNRFYKLFAVIHHRGKSVHNGHYICDVFHPGLPGWIRCDDQRVSVVHSREVLSNAASNGSNEDRTNNDLTPFILLYRQQQPQPPQQ